MIIRFKKDDHDLASKNFRRRAFDCPCSECKETVLDEDLVERLEKLRELVDCPVYINSAYRCEKHQERLAELGYETAKNSQHLLGRAADIETKKHTGHELEAFARQAGFRAVGVSKTWVHVDLRDDKDRAWGYLKR